MNIQQLNELDLQDLQQQLTRCCGAQKWVESVSQQRPFRDKQQFLEICEQACDHLQREDWLEAFSHHPKIGDIDNLRAKFASTQQWSENEQSSVRQASEETLQNLAQGNHDYEQRFGYIFIVCATGKSAGEMLEILQSRISNEAEEELQIAAQEQIKIMRLRLEKLLGSP